MLNMFQRIIGIPEKQDSWMHRSSGICIRKLVPDEIEQNGVQIQGGSISIGQVGAHSSRQYT